MCIQVRHTACNTQDLASWYVSSEIDGIPMCSNEGLLTTVLRDQWGFKGWVLGDDGAVRMMMETVRTN